MIEQSGMLGLCECIPSICGGELVGNGLHLFVCLSVVLSQGQVSRHASRFKFLRNVLSCNGLVTVHIFESDIGL